MDFKILDVFLQDGHLVVRAQHYYADGSLWFQEHYTWQGREGLKHKRRLNGAGDFLLDDGTTASRRLDKTPILPEGRTWARRVEPHLDDAALLGVIKSIHRERVASGWPASADSLPVLAHSSDDSLGGAALLSWFRRLGGSSHDS